MADSDSDSLSINSTVPSERESIYYVERILADQDTGEGIRYLVEWNGYPLEEATWEPPENFVQRDSIDEWEDRKTRIEDGLEEPYDFKEHERRLTKIEKETKLRKARRERKRARLGLFRNRRTGEWIKEQALASSDEQDEEPDVPQGPFEEDEGPLGSSERRIRRAWEVSLREPEKSDDLPSFRKHAKKARTVSQSDVPMKDVTEGRSSKEPRRKSSTTKSTYAGTMAKSGSMVGSKPAIGAQRSKNPDPRPKLASKTKPSTNKSVARNPSKASLKTGRSQLAGASIFRSGQDLPKQRKKSFGERIAQKKEGPQKHFSKLSTQRKFQLAGRREPAPNIEDLKFVDLGDGKVIGKDKVSEKQKTPYQVIQEEVAKNKLQAEKANKEPVPRTKSPSPMDAMDVDENSPTLFVEETHSEQIPPPGAQEHSVPRSESNQYHMQIDNQAPTVVENNAMVDATKEIGQKSSKEVVSDKVALPSEPTITADARRALPEKRTSLTLPETRLELGQKSTTSNQQGTRPIAPTDLNQHQERRGRDMPHGMGSETSAQSPISSNSQYGSASRSTDSPHLPPELQNTLQPLAFQSLIGNAGMGPPDEKARMIGKTDISDLFGAIMFEGVEKDEQRATFRGLTAKPTRVIMTLKKENWLGIKVHQFCNFTEYVSRYHKTGTKYFGAGHILPGPWGISVGKLAGQLNKLQKGGLCFAEYFTLVIYPPSLEDWESVNRLYPSKSPHSPLRFLLREAETSRYKEIHFPANSGNSSHANVPPAPVAGDSLPSLDYISHNLQTEPTRDPRLQHSKGSSNSHSLISVSVSQQSASQAGQHKSDSLHASPKQSIDQKITRQISNFDKLIKKITAGDEETVVKLFKEELNINWKSMVPRNNNKAADDQQIEVTVFVQYPSQLGRERGVLNLFLQKMGVKRYDSSSTGDWRAFSDNRKAGIILFHDSEQDLRALRSLGRLLCHPGINVFRINLGSPYAVIKGQPQITPVPGYKRLFPSGSEVLLTDSVFFQNPCNVARLLKWFREYILKAKPPFTWQIFTRPKLPNWIPDLLTELDPGSSDEFRPYFEIFKEFKALIKPGDMEPDGLTPKPKAPYHSAYAIPGYDLKSGLGSSKANQQTLEINEDKLVNWFGETSIQHIESRRRFSVLYDGPQEATEKWKAKWTHLRFFSSEEYVSCDIVAWEKGGKQKQAASAMSPMDARGSVSKKNSGTD